MRLISSDRDIRVLATLDSPQHVPEIVRLQPFVRTFYTNIPLAADVTHPDYRSADHCISVRVGPQPSWERPLC